MKIYIMKYVFYPQKNESNYSNEKWLKKNFNKEIAEGMAKFIGALDAADNAYDIKQTPSFFMEHKKANLKEYYSISLDKKKSKWRLMIQMLNDNDEVVTPKENEKEFLLNIKKIKIKELSEHYDEY